jgi:hypothetical protein
VSWPITAWLKLLFDSALFCSYFLELVLLKKEKFPKWHYCCAYDFAHFISAHSPWDRIFDSWPEMLSNLPRPHSLISAELGLEAWTFLPCHPAGGIRAVIISSSGEGQVGYVKWKGQEPSAWKVWWKISLVDKLSWSLLLLFIHCLQQKTQVYLKCT